MEKCLFTDNDYNLPKKAWVLGPFYDFFIKELGRLNISVWDKKFDCDDFSSMFRLFAQICHKASKGEAEGIAVSEIGYIKESGEQHAITCAFTDKGPIFLEPQTGEPLLLTDNEIQSIYRVRM